MEISHLSSFGIPEIIVESWRDRLGGSLLPVQQKAVQQCDLLGGRSLLICAPTSSGKTFCGELAAAAAIFRRQKALFLVPLKSIAEEKYFEAMARYGNLGIRVVISTRDHHEFDRQLERGEFDLGILVYEKFNSLLVKNIDLLNTVDLILIDEIQMIGDPGRGGTLETALLKIMASKRRPQLVALSAVLQEPQQLADWLGCELLSDQHRPVELRQGVLTGNCFRYRVYETGTEGQETMAEIACDSAEEALLANVQHLVDCDEQVLVFMKSKRCCEEMALRLAERSFRPAAENTISLLGSAPSSSLVERLMATLMSAVAFHHADLSFSQRRLLEEGYRSGEIRVLVCTTTLAMGVNLPAQSVFIDCYKYAVGKRSSQAMILPLGWSEYEGMSGRAGRLGQGGEYGRSILIAGSTLEAESYWQAYVSGHPEEVQSRLFGDQTIDDVTLDLIASGAADKTESLQLLLQRSLFCRCGGELSEAEIDASVARHRERGLIFGKEGKLEISPLGSLICRRGITVATATAIIRVLQRHGGEDPLSWFFLILGMPDALDLRLPPVRGETVKLELRQRLDSQLAEIAIASEHLSKLTERDYQVTDLQWSCLAGALLLFDWIGAATTLEIERRHQMNIGSILAIAERCGWLLEAAAELASLRGFRKSVVKALKRFALAVHRGYDLPDSGLSRLGFGAEQRDLAWALQRRGITTRADFTEVNRGVLSGILGETEAGRLIKRAERKHGKANKQMEEEREMPKLRLPRLERGGRVKIDFGNTEIDISHKSFNYLFKLAAGRLLTAEGWLDKEAIEPGFNQAKNIYRVKQELKNFGTGLERCIENNKSGRYRLNLNPSQIQVDFQTMRAFSDQELAELSERVEMKQVVVSN